MKLNIMKSVKKVAKASKVAGAGWWKEPDRHSKAAKTGHAGGQYSINESGNGKVSTSGGSSGSSGGNGSGNATAIAPSHAHKPATNWSGGKFCEVCGKAL